MTRLRVILVDDHPVVLEGLLRILEREHDVVAALGDGESALAQAAVLAPDVVVCDISMPGVNGFEVARELKRVSPGSKMVFLTMHADPAYVSEAFRIGVAGYVLKTAGATELTAAIRAAAAGETYVSSRLGKAPQLTSNTER